MILLNCPLKLNDSVGLLHGAALFPWLKNTRNIVYHIFSIYSVKGQCGNKILKHSQTRAPWTEADGHVSVSLGLMWRSACSSKSKLLQFLSAKIAKFYVWVANPPPLQNTYFCHCVCLRAEVSPSLHFY